MLIIRRGKQREHEELEARGARVADCSPVREYGSETILVYGAQDLILGISFERKKD
jgi:hypothetical protein